MDQEAFDSHNIIEISSPRVADRMRHEVDRRLEQLWGNYKAFANTRKVSHLFSLTVSEFFGIKARQMAKNFDMVWEALYTCGAADALMNKTLPVHIRRQYELAYNIHRPRGVELINAAIGRHSEDRARGVKLEVLPLYYAIFLLHASGACRSGYDEIALAERAFEYFDTLTDEFPLKIKVIDQSGSNGGWKVQMLVGPQSPANVVTVAKGT
ncbi:hypothetical protein HYFRA_00014106 [Hymenoscyphus fraxineus]|uniref:Uncharacterized protein n=1 Tax=Hymenoscyphus fraxineus TaxID=746836 RepID=A0A9N9LCF9_9HELO|nr:hypothetical protein HYFRA_00014106 [Hymenoscyphus fraxineus]